jgi:hypothetical protein
MIYIEHMFHRAWVFPSGKGRSAILAAYPAMQPYSRLHYYAGSHWHELLTLLCHPRPPPDQVTGLCPHRTIQMGAAQLLFDFDYGDMVQWLGGEYMIQGRNWEAMSNLFETLRGKPQLPGYPSLDFDPGLGCNMEGVPLQGNCVCNLDDQCTRAAYDNHGPVSKYGKDVRKKFAAEE